MHKYVLYSTTNMFWGMQRKPPVFKDDFEHYDLQI